MNPKKNLILLLSLLLAGGVYYLVDVKWAGEKKAEEERKAAEMSETRRAQVGTAERSEKIRTYNYPQDRITDHRINASFHGMPKIMDGYLDEIIDALTSWEEERALAEGVAP